MPILKQKKLIHFFLGIMLLLNGEIWPKLKINKTMKQFVSAKEFLVPIVKVDILYTCA